MKVKEFFKLNKWKIIITILLLFPLSQTTCISTPPEGCTTAYVPIILAFFSGIPPFGIRFPLVYNIVFNISVALTSIIFAYLISCGVVYIYKKLKK